MAQNLLDRRHLHNCRNHLEFTTALRTGRMSIVKTRARSSAHPMRRFFLGAVSGSGVTERACSETSSFLARSRSGS